MKRIIISIAVAMSLAFLSLAVPTVASAQTTQTARTAQTHSISDSQSDYVGYCVSAIKDAVRDTVVDWDLDKVLHLPKAAKIYDIYTTGSDEAQLKYELNHKQYLSAPFSASRVLYDFLGQFPDTGKFWSIGTPATSCLEAAVAWDIETGHQVGTQLRKNLEKYLSWLLPAAPTGLTVRADPSDGTVLLLTWQDNANNETSFEVNNGVESRSAPAHPGTGTVNYTWTGLKPGSWTCLRVRETNAYGSSAWDPNAAPWYTCATTSSPHSLMVKVAVPAKAQGGVSTGVDLTIGNTYRITGTGSARYGYDPGEPCAGYPTTHPDGSRYLGTQNCGPKQDPSAALASAPIGLLIWRIGNGPWQPTPTSFTAATVGRLYVAYNDDPGEYSDNAASYTATITCGSPAC